MARLIKIGDRQRLTCSAMSPSAGRTASHPILGTIQVIPAQVIPVQVIPAQVTPAQVIQAPVIQERVILAAITRTATIQAVIIPATTIRALARRCFRWCRRIKLHLGTTGSIPRHRLSCLDATNEGSECDWLARHGADQCKG